MLPDQAKIMPGVKLEPTSVSFILMIQFNAK
jgi:hypothetical protein